MSDSELTDPSPPQAQGTVGAQDAPVEDISWQEAPRIIASGACIGTADLVPGVSGGTMAVALGIYRQLLAAITSVGPRALRLLLKGQLRQLLEVVHVRFIASLGIGIGIALAIMGKGLHLHELVSTSPKPLYAAFFGLVVGSTVLLARTVSRWDLSSGALALAGAVLGVVVVSLVPTQTPETPAFVFLSGAIAICAMILPGISGSFILLILGKYEYVVNGVLHAELSVLLPFAAGAALGLAAFSRVLGKALDRHHNAVVAGLSGLLVGSLWRIWPYQQLEHAVIRGKSRVIQAEPYLPANFELWVFGLMLGGFVLVLGIEWLARRRTQEQAEARPA